MASEANIISDWEWKLWSSRLGSKPVERLAHEDRSASYEMNCAHVYRLENGQYALVTESGCSCYESDDAVIDLFPSAVAALASFEKWKKENPNAD